MGQSYAQQKSALQSRPPHRSYSPLPWHPIPQQVRPYQVHWKLLNMKLLCQPRERLGHIDTREDDKWPMQGTPVTEISWVLIHCSVAQALPGVHGPHPSMISLEALAQQLELPSGKQKSLGSICPWSLELMSSPKTVSWVLEQASISPNLC